MNDSEGRYAQTAYDVHALLRTRWSPLAFAQRRIDDSTLRSLFEAARWAPSGFNAQPWRFVVAKREDKEAFEKILSCLVAPNQTWARHAGALVLTAARARFAHNDAENRHAWHDLGLATAQLIVQATALDLSVHAMSGFDSEALRQTLQISDAFDPVAVLALGYAGDARTLPPDLLARDGVPRERQPQSEFVFAETWDKPWSGDPIRRD